MSAPRLPCVILSVRPAPGACPATGERTTHVAAWTALGTQLTDGNGRGRCPELQLLAAILEDALKVLSHCPLRHRGRAWRDFLEARQWLFEDNADWPFSFVNVCDLLGIDPVAVRHRLRPLIEIQTRPPTPAPHCSAAAEVSPAPAPAEPATAPVISPEAIERERFETVMWDEA